MGVEAGCKPTVCAHIVLVGWTWWIDMMYMCSITMFTSPNTMQKMIKFSVVALFVMIGPTYGQLCHPNEQRIDCGKSYYKIIMH